MKRFVALFVPVLVLIAAFAFTQGAAVGANPHKILRGAATGKLRPAVLTDERGKERGRPPPAVPPEAQQPGRPGAHGVGPEPAHDRGRARHATHVRRWQ